MKPIPLTLAADQKLELQPGLTLRYDNLVIEEIAAGGPGYPAGSGLTLSLIVESSSQGGLAPGLWGPTQLSVSLLSEGYTSKPEAWFDFYRVTVTDVTSPHRDAVVHLHVEQVTDQAGPPTIVNVAKGSTVPLDATEMTVVRSGNDQVTVEYSTPGESRVQEQKNFKPGEPRTWRWRDHRLTLLDMSRLEVARLQLAPVQPR